MAAEVLSQHGVRVDVYDSMSSLGRKFLMAGKSGLNLTHSEPFERFVQRYSTPEVAGWLKDFTPDDLRDWAKGLGIETFVGTSGRVFPVNMKASPLLRAWLKRLDGSGVIVHLRHKWTGWDSSGALRFEMLEGERLVRADATILALGGGSWARLGSTGEWVDGLRQAGVQVRELRPANCGFDVDWSEHFRTRFEGQPIKSVVLSFGDFQQQGEFIITREGVEGSLIYAASARLRDGIEAHGRAVLFLDLAPGSTQEKLTAALSKPRGSRSMSSHIERTVGLKGVKVGLLHEFVAKEDFNDSAKLAAAIKHLPVPLLRPRPLDEAISSAGGVTFDSLDAHLMLKAIPGVFCAGEMLDWEAPTGGYLLTACFAGGRVAAHGVLDWLKIIHREEG
ncbi:MAG: TIGR03862 family flavoprotein [Chloroflexi bacterium]|nr:TIGR03862 family flavoprotein [Chloroflexota bacterium]